jgi:hypothetical protein
MTMTKKEKEKEEKVLFRASASLYPYGVEPGDTLKHLL